MRKFLLLGFSLVLVYQAWTQNRTITGKVTSAEDGSALPGVNVFLKGTNTGTVTDASGNYRLAGVPASGGVLVFSFIGFQTQEVAVGDRSVVDVIMEADITQLSEVVVTGVGVATEKRRLAIDVTSVTDKNFNPSAVASLDQALQGKIAGAQILLNSGEPGATANIQLRGINSLGNANPIILLDGVQIGTGNSASALAGLDISNIERVEVVKGAAAGMLYGAQGANGVIQIFTKRGSRNQRLSVTLSSKAIIDEVIRGKHSLIAELHHYDTDAEGFILSTGGGRIAPDPVTGTWSDPEVNLTPNLLNNKPYRERTFDHLDQVYRRAFSHNTSLNMSGGSNKVDYSFNVNNLLQQNVRFGDLDRKNIGVNLGVELFEGFSFRNTTQFVIETENLQSGNRFSVVNAYPWIDFNATYDNGFKVIKPKSENEYNPLSELEWRTRESRNNRLIQNINLNYKFPKFVEVDYKYGVQLWNTNYSDIIRSQKGFLQPSDAFWGQSPGTGTVTLRNDKSTYQNSLLSLIVRTDFKNDFNSSLPIITTTQLTYDWRKDEYENFFGYANGFAYPPYNLTNGSTKNSGSYSESFITFGYLVNQNIDYGTLAGVSFGFRSDYSSEFGFNPDGKIKPFLFPRGTAYFNAGEIIKSSFAPGIKLRAAYGEAGVQPDRFARQPVLSGRIFGDIPGLYVPDLGKNAFLRVQRNKELEVGTDISLVPSVSEIFLSKIDIGLTYWTRKGLDIIQPAGSPPSSGSNQLVDNYIELSSNGIELNFDVNAVKLSNFEWNLGLKFSTAETIVDKVASGLEVPYGENGTFLIRQGQPLGVFIGQVPITSLDATYPDGTPYIDPSEQDDYAVVDGQYGKLVIHKTTKVAVLRSSDDKVVMGNPQPKFFGSIVNDFTLFRKLFINMQWDFMKGNKIYNQTRQWLYRDRLSKDFDLPLNIDGEVGAFVTTYNSLYNSVQPTGWFVEDGSFLRLRNLSLSYSLSDVIKWDWVKQFSVNFAARNIITITNYRGLDPESTSTSNASSAGVSTGPARGIDSFNFPNLKSYQLGITIGF